MEENMGFLKSTTNKYINESEKIVSNVLEIPSDTPRIGVFWLHLKNGKIEILFSKTMVLGLGHSYGNYIIDQAGHYDIWESLKSHGIIPKNSNYEDLPRGRVSYDQVKKQYVIYHGSYIKSSPCIKQVIKSEFNLKRDIRWEPDLHYDKFKRWGF